MSDGYKEQAASREHWDTKRADEIDRLTRERDEAREALQIAADSFRSHGFAVDADEAEAALAGTTVQPSAALDFRDRITAILMAYRCQYTSIDGEEHEGLPLVDALTPPGAQTVELGKREIELLADELAAGLSTADNAPAPAPNEK